MNDPLPASPHTLTAIELLSAYRSGQLSPVEATTAVLDRIAALDDRVNAFVRVEREGALAAARASEARWAKGAPQGLLDGVPVTIKDLVLTRGIPTMMGSRTVDPGQPWEVDAPATARLREAGAVILGKTCTPEFGHKFVTDSPLSGITRNPWNPALSPGGSSGGAAAALAMGFGPLAVGTDGGGSIRIPAGWSGVVGHKPTAGRVPIYPTSRWGTLSTLGPMARTVSDAALLMTVLSAPDGRDWFELPPDGRDYRVGLEDGVRGLRIAYSPDLGLARADAEIAGQVRIAVERLAELGARVEEIAPPGIEAIGGAHVLLKSVFFAHMVDAMTERQRDVLDPSFAAQAQAGHGVSAIAFQAALVTRREVGVRMQALLHEYDLLAMPTHHIPPPPVPGYPPGMEGAPFPFSAWVNHTTQPATTVPCGLTATGLPVGLQLVGAKYADALVLRVARAYESARGPFPEAPLARS